MHRQTDKRRRLTARINPFVHHERRIRVRVRIQAWARVRMANVEASPAVRVVVTPGDWSWRIRDGNDVIECVSDLYHMNSILSLSCKSKFID